MDGALPPACKTAKSALFCCDLSQRKMAWAEVHIHSDGTGDTDIWQVGAWAEALPKVSRLCRKIGELNGADFFIPSYFVWEVGRAEVLQQCLPDGFLSQRQMGPFGYIKGRQI